MAHVFVFPMCVPFEIMWDPSRKVSGYSDIRGVMLVLFRSHLETIIGQCEAILKYLGAQMSIVDPLARLLNKLHQYSSPLWCTPEPLNTSYHPDRMLIL